MGFCHQGTARPRVAGGGDGLQTWKIAANILNKQSRTADNGWSSSFVFVRWIKESTQACCEGTSEFDGFFRTILASENGRDFGHGILGIDRAGSQKSSGSELEDYNLERFFTDRRCDVLDRKRLSRDTDQWRALVNTVIDLPVSWKQRISWLAEWLLPSQKGLCSMELVRYNVQNRSCTC
jgi:hypothetical protein